MNISRCNLEINNFTQVVDNEMDFKSIKPTRATFPRPAKPLNTRYPLIPKIMANDQFSGINDTDSGIFSFNLMEETTQSLQTTGHDFNKSVVLSSLGKADFQNGTIIWQ